MNTGSAFVRCALSRGAFSGERVFDIKLADGENYIGIAPRDSCFVEGRAVGPDEPKAGEILIGELQAHLVRNGGNNAEVFIPDGELVMVPADAVTQ